MVPNGPDARRGALTAAGFRTLCALGRAGVIQEKREGDGATPSGRHRLVAVLYRTDRMSRPHTLLPVAAIGPDAGWCDDQADRNYNRPVRLPYPGSAERLWRDDRLYDLVVVLDYNLRPAKPGRGSAIFLHLATPDFAPTAGCVAVDAEAMRRLLAAASEQTFLIVHAGRY